MQKQSAQNAVYSREQYGKAQFWDQRYHQTGGYFDWYAEFPQLQYAFQSQYGMKHDDSILMVGCGNSLLSQQMFDAGYTNIINIDISPSVIKQMQQASPKMIWQVMDATNMTYKNHTFDYIIDKGTMDALIAGKDLSLSIKLLKQCMRVTKQQGQVILITYGSPEGRRKVFQNALPINKHDYYFSYINLNDMSTMINLMRTNLGGLPMNKILQQKQVFAQSMKQFMMIKLMRNKRSKDKQFVVWTNYQKKTQVQIQQPLKKTSLNQQNKESKVQNLNQNKVEEKEPQKQNKVQKEKDSQQSKFTYKPKKQSYVYAYSIKRKFGYDLEQVLQSADKIQLNKMLEDLNERNQVEGDSSLIKLNLLCNKQQINKNLAESIFYLQNKNIAHSKIIINGSNINNNEDTLNVDLTSGFHNKITILRKTNIAIKFKFAEFTKISKILSELCELITRKMDLQIHPCPKTYALFTMLKGRMNKKTSNELLKQYWYPTYSLHQIDLKDKVGQAIISIPPLLPSFIQKVIAIITETSLKSYKQSQLKIINIHHGFVSFPQLKLLSLLTTAGLSFNNGKKYQICLQQFWQGKESKNQQTNASQIYNVNHPKIQVIKQQLTVTLAYLFALY